jgi:nucleoside phosphorylase
MSLGVLSRERDVVDKELEDLKTKLIELAGFVRQLGFAVDRYEARENDPRAQLERALGSPDLEGPQLLASINGTNNAVTEVISEIDLCLELSFSPKAVSEFKGRRSKPSVVLLSNGPSVTDLQDRITRELQLLDHVLLRLPHYDSPAAQSPLGDTSSREWSNNIADYRGRVHMVIITVKSEEEDEILARFPRQHSVRGQRIYGLSRVENHERVQLLVATVRQPKQGNIYASAITKDVIADLDPKWILLVGIAGASPFGDAILGDVVLGTHIHDLTVHARNADGSTSFSSGGGAATVDVEATVVHLRSTLKSAMVFPKPEIQVDATKLDFTTDDEAVNQKIAAAISAGRAPRILDGSIISTDALVKDVELVKTWRDTIRDGLAVEMESAGAYHASRTLAKTYAMLSIRGISDIVGVKKHEGAVLHACRVAAECAFQFVRHWSPPDAILAPDPR